MESVCPSAVVSLYSIFAITGITNSALVCQKSIRHVSPQLTRRLGSCQLVAKLLWTCYGLAMEKQRGAVPD